jgi:putative two-component system response regulator
MTIADNYDALLSERVYKPSFSYEATAKLMAEQSGRRFDPVMLDIMLSNIKQFEAIHKDFMDAKGQQH